MKRNGVTLIELVAVVVIIVVLASIAVPAYLKAMDRAKKARLAADFQTVAISLEEFKADWGHYPAMQQPNIAITTTGSSVNQLTVLNELTGSATSTSTACQNSRGKHTVFGDLGPYTYITRGTLLGIRNPLSTKTTGGYWSGLRDQSVVYYCSSGSSGAPTGQHWALWVYGPENSSLYYYVSDSQATLTAQKIGITTALTIGARSPALP